VAAAVLVNVGEGLSVLTVLFSAHPAAKPSSRTERIGDNLITLIARRACRLTRPCKKYPSALPTPSMGFCTQGNTKLLSHLIRTKKEAVAFRSIESNCNLTCLGVLCPIDFPQRLRRVSPQFHHTTFRRPALSEPSHEA